MIIPDVQLRDLAIHSGKRLRVIPSDIVVQIVVVAFSAELLREGIVPTLLGIADLSPGTQRAANPDTVVVDLVTASDHDVVGRGLVLSDNSVPQTRAAPGSLIGADTEPVARVEHDAHRLGRSGDEEAVGSWFVLAGETQLGDEVFVFDLGRLDWDDNVEGPERVARIGVEALGLNAGAASLVVDSAVGLAFGGRQVSSGPNSSEDQRGLEEDLSAAALDHNEDAAIPATVIHATVVEQRAAHNLLAIGGLFATERERILPGAIASSISSGDYNGLVPSAGGRTVGGALDTRLIDEAGKILGRVGRMVFARSSWRPTGRPDTLLFSGEPGETRRFLVAPLGRGSIGVPAVLLARHGAPGSLALRHGRLYGRSGRI